MSNALWFGTEWEIALSAIDRTGAVADTGNLLAHIDRTLVQHLRHVPDGGRGWWLENGARYYRDAAQGAEGHDELCSAECCHPDELLLQEMAGERLVLGLADLVASKAHFEKVNVSKSNVCYSASTSWGSHENYEASQQVDPVPMLAWLASRILLTGSGGLEAGHPGIRFTLSPRAHFIDCPVSRETEFSRGLHNSGKAEPLGTRHRVHVVAGDGNRAPLSTWLKVATTAIVIRLLDTNQGPDLALERPVEDLKAFALNSGMTSGAPDSREQLERALDIQFAFLESARNAAGDLPGWAPLALARWQSVLETLASKSTWRGLVGQLDWPTKLATFEMILKKHGWNWGRVGEVNNRMSQTLADIDEGISQGNPPRRGRHAAMMTAVGKSLGPTLVEEFVELRQKLAVVDARYMQLGLDSLYDHVADPLPEFRKLADSLSPDPFELPLPKSGRARARAKLIREHGGTGERGESEASWTYFVAKGRYLSMPNVSDENPRDWSETSPRLPHSSGQERREPNIFTILRAARRSSSSLNSGDYPRGTALLREVEPLLSPPRPGSFEIISYWRQSVRVHARLQDERSMEDSLYYLKLVDPEDMEYLWEECNAKTWLGLRGHACVPELGDQVKRKMAQVRTRASGVACWKSHFATWLNRHGKPAEALELLESTLESEYGATSPSVQVRIHTQMAEADRILGNYDTAEQYLSFAERTGRTGRVRSGLIDYVQTGQARLLAQKGDHPAATRLMLETILPAQRRLRMPNLIRTQLMLARLQPGRQSQLTWEDERRMIKHAAHDYAGFANCPLLAQIFKHWVAWCEGKPHPTPDSEINKEDFFWGA
ncbi:proteasome accessory factor PafA2 family protein [Haloferula sp. A504]|uniref:proteasome accessory factor PafA2 family protein n=1 Tax=Haloferula sp. A504 TaxID=3373601 RepID=UPI0031CC111E|nr:proteasome accessory factor PafA2 family protein [Verrucomicrobiaceae bacterium E54]